MQILLGQGYKYELEISGAVKNREKNGIKEMITSMNLLLLIMGTLT